MDLRSCPNSSAKVNLIVSKRMLVFRYPLRQVSKLPADFCADLFLCALFLFFCSTALAAKPPVTAIAFAPDGRSVVIGSQAGLSIRSWPDLKMQGKSDTSLVNIHDLAFSPDGQSLAVAGGSPAEQGLVELFAWPGLKSISVYKGHEDSVFAVEWINNSKFTTSSLDHAIALWDIKSEKPVLRLRGHSRGVSTLCYLPKEHLLISGGMDQNLVVWKFETSEAESAVVVRTLNNHTREVHQIAARLNNKGLPLIASISNDRTVRFWQPTIGRMVRFAKLNSTPLAVVWLPDKFQVAIATADGHLRIIDSLTTKTTCDIPAIEGWAYSLETHPTDGSLLIGGQNGQLKRIVVDAPAYCCLGEKYTP